MPSKSGRPMASEEVRVEVTRVLDEHGRAAERLDVPAAAEMFAEDARMMLPGMATIEGRERIAELMAEAWQAVKPVRIQFSTEEVYGLGEMAVTVGSYHFVLHPADAEPTEDKGRFMLLWAQDEGGAWRVVRDVTNSSIPSS